MLRLTPKGKRFGDVIRRELANPDSIISQATRKLNAWRRLAKSDPCIQFELSILRSIQVRKYESKSRARNNDLWFSDTFDICPYPTTVENWFEDSTPVTYERTQI